MKLVIKTVVHQPVDVAFAYITNPCNELQWNANLVAVEGDNLEAWGVGSQCTMVFGPPQHDRVPITVTHLIRDQQYGFKSPYGLSMYHFYGNGDRTRISFETEVAVRGFMLHTVKSASLKRHLEARLTANFKRLETALKNPSATSDDCAEIAAETEVETEV